MRLNINTESGGDPTNDPITSVDILLDNGEWFRLYEERPSASQCELRIVKDAGRIAVLPISDHEVKIGRAQ